MKLHVWAWVNVLGAVLAVTTTIVACTEESRIAGPGEPVEMPKAMAPPAFIRAITQVPPIHPTPGGTYPVSVSGLDRGLLLASLAEVERVSGLRLPVVDSGAAVTVTVSGSHPDILSPDGGYYYGACRLRLAGARWTGAVWTTTSHVSGADIVIHPTAPRVVVLHELGHFLGLGHVDGDEYVMSVTSPDDMDRFHPYEAAAVEWLQSTVTSGSAGAVYRCGGRS